MMTQEQAKTLLKNQGLRATAPRLAVLLTLAFAQTPLSYTEVVDRLKGEPWDPATIYRNLIKLSESGVASIISRAEGISRYALNSQSGDQHKHPHFVCDDCGQISCLPAELTASLSVDESWASSIASAVIQLRGECPKCLVSSFN